MYQEIDDIEDLQSDKPTKTGLNRLKVFTLILIGIGVLIFATIATGPEIDSPDPGPTEDDIYAVYTKALIEPQPALRRARLIDFIETFPDHDRIQAAKVQLSVINEADDKDWASLTEVVYDPANSVPVKLAAIELYDELWGSHLLGSREADLARLRDTVQESFDEAPSSDNEEGQLNFEPEPDQFDPSIDDAEMAGGISTRSSPYYIQPSNSSSMGSSTSSGKVVKPRIRKNVQPRYPSRALRNELSAIVVLALNLDRDGDVETTEVLSVKAVRYHRDFIKAAERAALRTKYYPKTVDGKPVPTVVTKRYVFRLD